MYGHIAHRNLMHAKRHNVELSVFAFSRYAPLPSLSINGSSPWAYLCDINTKFFLPQPIIVTKSSVQRGIDLTLLTESSSIFWSLVRLVKPPSFLAR